MSYFGASPENVIYNFELLQRMSLLLAPLRPCLTVTDSNHVPRMAQGMLLVFSQIYGLTSFSLPTMSAPLS